MISGLLTSTFAIAQSQELGPDGLYLSPNLCLLSKKEVDCQIKIEARWKAQRTGNICLISSTQIEPLHCWTDTTSARHTFSLKIERSIVISLIDKDSHKVIFKQPVRLQRQVTRYRKKRRNPWQFY